MIAEPKILQIINEIFSIFNMNELVVAGRQTFRTFYFDGRPITKDQ